MTPQGNSSILPYSVWTRTICEWLIAGALLIAERAALVDAGSLT